MKRWLKVVGRVLVQGLKARLEAVGRLGGSR